MAGILDFLQSPDAQLGIGLLAAGGPTTDPNQTGFGQRLQSAMNGMTANQQIALRAKLMQSQIDENASQNALRQAQLGQQAKRDAYFMGDAGYAGPAAGAAAPGLPGSAGVQGGAPMAAPGVAAQGAPVAAGGDRFSQWSAQYGIPRDALVNDYMTNGGKGIAEMLMKRGTPDMQVSNGYAYDKNRIGAGYLPSLNISQDGKSSMVQIGPDGLPVVSAPRGAVDTFGAYQGAQANYKPIKVYNPATGREEYTTEGAVVGGRQAQRTGNPLVDAVMQTESNGNPNAVSPKGAQGLMQVMPGTNTSPGFGVSPARDGSEAERTRVGQDYLGKMKEKYGGNDTLAAIAYNWGPGNTDMWIKSGGDYSKLPAETKNYVSAVMTRSAVNGLGGGQQSAAPAGNYAAGPSANEAASAAGRQATASSIGGKAGELLKESSDAANSATQSVASAQRMVQALDSNKVLTGPTASLRLKGLQIASVLGMQGKDDAEKIANTRQAVQEMAKLTLEGRKQMSGQGAITNQESALAEKATSGSIDDLTAPEIRQLAQAAERTGRWKYSQHEAKMNAMSQDPAMAGNVALYKAAPMPDAISSPSSDKPAGKPPIPMKGMVQDGYKFKGGNAADPTSWEKM
jgi:hypothetical protein